MKLRCFFVLMIVVLFIQSCGNAPNVPPTTVPSTATPIPSPTHTLTPTQTATLVPSETPTPRPLIPNFEHIAIIMFENKEFGSVIGNSSMANYNRLASDYTLLTEYYAVTHPSLPNYLALMGGDTFGIDRNCNDCFIDETSLPDLIEASGRTWKTYQDEMPSPCFLGDTNKYVQKHNPFIYFDDIRLDPARCERSVVPLTTLHTDILTASLPNFFFVMPDLCNSSHDCPLTTADAWLTNLLAELVPALDATGQAYVIFMLFEEGQGDHSCCGLPESAGGRVPFVIYSPIVKNGFEDNTPYTHYSLLKTIAQAWGLPFLGHAAEEENALIIAPWK